MFMSSVIFAACSSSESTTNSAEADEEQVSTDSIELTIAHSLTSTHPIETEVIPQWAEALEEATDGVITLDSYPVDTILSSEGIYDGVVNGVVDMGMSFFAYTPGRFPVMSSVELPGIPMENAHVGTNVGMDLMEEFDPEEIQDTHVMMVGTTGPAYIITQEPVQELSDLAGMEIRTTGASAGGIETIGGIAVSMPMSEAYESLSRGIVNGMLGASEIIETFNLNEVTSYVTETPFMYNGLYFITMNQDTWDSIPEEYQQKIEEVNEWMVDEVLPQYWDGANANGLDNEGMEMITLSDEERENWIEALEEYQEQYVEELNGQGLPGEEILDFIKTSSEKYNEEF
jgi:TRAP-type C4-dicarboxylate transport system substrate-binding protein